MVGMPLVIVKKGEEGMEPDDLLCSRTARPEKTLVGRAQWKINPPPSPERDKRAWKEHVFRWTAGEGLPILPTSPSGGAARLSFTARIGRALFHRARSASKKDGLAVPLSPF